MEGRGVSKEAKAPTEKVQAKNKAVKTQETQRRRLPEPPRTAFNFVAAEIDERRKKRQSILVVGSVAVVAFTLTATLGLWAQKGASAAQKEQAAFEAEIQTARASVAQAFGAGDFDVPRHVEVRTAQLSATLGSDVDILPLFELLRKSSITGVYLSSIAISLESSTASEAPVTTLVTTTDPKATTTTTLPPKVTYKYKVRLTAKGKNPCSQRLTSLRREPLKPASRSQLILYSPLMCSLRDLTRYKTISVSLLKSHQLP